MINGDSDHIPVWLVIESPRKKQADHRVIGRWLTQHLLFISANGDEHHHAVYDVDLSLRLISSKKLHFVRMPRPGRPF